MSTVSIGAQTTSGGEVPSGGPKPKPPVSPPRLATSSDGPAIAVNAAIAADNAVVRAGYQHLVEHNARLVREIIRLHGILDDIRRTYRTGVMRRLSGIRSQHLRDREAVAAELSAMNGELLDCVTAMRRTAAVSHPSPSRHQSHSDVNVAADLSAQRRDADCRRIDELEEALDQTVRERDEVKRRLKVVASDHAAHVHQLQSVHADRVRGLEARIAVLTGASSPRQDDRPVGRETSEKRISSHDDRRDSPPRATSPPGRWRSPGRPLPDARLEHADHIEAHFLRRTSDHLNRRAASGLDVTRDMVLTGSHAAAHTVLGNRRVASDIRSPLWKKEATTVRPPPTLRASPLRRTFPPGDIIMAPLTGGYAAGLASSRLKRR